MQLEVWDRSRLGDVMAIVDAAMPGEALTEDDVAANLFDDPDPVRVVAGGGDGGDGGGGAGVVAAVVRTGAEGRLDAFVQLVAVHPREQRRGVGQALLADVHRWAFDEMGAASMQAGAGAPFYLWPGVDVHAIPAQSLFEAMGYRPFGGVLDLQYSSRFRAPAPDGVVVRRVIDDSDADRALSFVSVHWPNWVAECRRGIEHATCHLAVEQATDQVLAFGCHSVNRFGFLGPIGTNPDRQSRGVGTALLSAIASDVMAAGLDTVQVAWIGPVRFYAKAAGATTSRAYLKLGLPRPRPSA